MADILWHAGLVAEDVQMPDWREGDRAPMTGTKIRILHLLRIYEQSNLPRNPNCLESTDWEASDENFGTALARMHRQSGAAINWPESQLSAIDSESDDRGTRCNRLAEYLLARETGIKFLSIKEALALKELDLRGLGALEDALYAPMIRCLEEDDPSINDLATMMAKAIESNRPLVAGNEQFALLCCEAFLAKNGANPT